MPRTLPLRHSGRPAGAFMVSSMSATWDDSRYTITCVLAAHETGPLRADGCVLHTSAHGSALATPDQLTCGSFVKVKLWLEEQDPIDIRLAEVTKVHEHWISLDLIH